MKKICWQNYVISALLAVGVIILWFNLRTHISGFAIGQHLIIELRPLVIGVLCGAVLSGVSLAMKRKIIPAVCAAVLGVTWFFVPGISVFSSVLCGFAGICCLGGIPFYAALFEKIPQKISHSA